MTPVKPCKARWCGLQLIILLKTQRSQLAEGREKQLEHGEEVQIINMRVVHEGGTIPGRSKY